MCVCVCECVSREVNLGSVTQCARVLPLCRTKRLSVHSPTAQTHGEESTQRRGRTQRQNASSGPECNLQRQTNLQGPRSANVMKKILEILPQNNNQCSRNFVKSLTLEPESQKICTASALNKPVQTRSIQNDKCTTNSAAEPVESLCSSVCTLSKYFYAIIWTKSFLCLCK